jgi:hypothetical protein
MGNRAIVHFKNDDDKHGIYLHWNGGPESVLAFLKVMEERKWTRMDYASARFTAVVSEFFDASGDCSGLSLGILENKDCGAADWDNGLFQVSRSNDGFVVTQKLSENTSEKLVTYADLDAREKVQHAGIVDALAKTRAARKARKASA